jgi:hypothetical protein
MKRLSAAAVFLLGFSGVVHAQNEIPTATAHDNVALDFAQTSAVGQPTATVSNQAPPFFVISAQPSSVSSSFNLAASSAPAAPATFAPQPAADPSTPAIPSPRYDPTERDERWALGLGFAFFRFRSSVYTASAVGLNSSLAYSLNNWLAIEGAITSAFAPTIYRNEHIKYVGYGAGPRISLGRDRLEPWVHVLAGGVHILPQTAFSGKNGFEVLAGGGIDYNLNSRFAARLEADWVNTHVFGQSQNNGQASLGVVFRF